MYQTSNLLSASALLESHADDLPTCCHALLVVGGKPTNPVNSSSLIARASSRRLSATTISAASAVPAANPTPLEVDGPIVQGLVHPSHRVVGSPTCRQVESMFNCRDRSESGSNENVLKSTII